MYRTTKLLDNAVPGCLQIQAFLRAFWLLQLRTAMLRMPRQINEFHIRLSLHESNYAHALVGAVLSNVFV